MITTAVSLFAGVGGFDLALQRSGIDVVAAVEIDPKARAVLEKQFPNTQLFEDVCQVSGKDFINAGFTPNEGIMVGGFPCQDLSVAGKRSGLAGDRSGLFFEFIRLIDETKTKFVILENVPGLLSSNKGRDMGTVIGSLDDLGYSVAWRVLDAQFFGVPQRRRRVFIVGCLGDDWRTPFEILAIKQGSAGHFAKSQQKRKTTPEQTSRGSRVSSGEIVGTLQASDYKFPQQQQAHENKIVIQDAFGQSGFAKYTEGVTTLTATSYKRPEDNVVVHEN